MKILKPARYWSLHTHSHFSNGDALPSVERIVAKAHELRYPALGLTDHGNIAGSVELYKQCARYGIKPLPGTEIYYVPSTEQYVADRKAKETKSQQFHMGIHAFTSEGYENLVRLSTATHANHHWKPLCDAAMLSEFAENGWLEGLAVTTGCHFGLAKQLLVHSGYEHAERWLKTLESWFPDRMYVELQQHEIEHEDAEGWNDRLVTDRMFNVAMENDWPVVITQDSHYVEEGERGAHETLKMLSSWSDTPDDATFPGDGFHMVDDEWMRGHYPEAIYEAGIRGLDHLLARHTLAIDVLDDYSYSVPSVTDNPQKEMHDRVWAFISERELGIEYSEKAVEEMAVIDEAGMASYMMLVAMITDYCREQGWLYQTRGSAAGSLVAWALGITQVDPLHWDLRFERFLSKDRTKPPDIDLDIQHDKRQQLIDWLRESFTVLSIGTWMSMSMAPSEEDEGKGSIMVKYYQYAAKVDGPQKWEDVPHDVREALYALDRQDAYTGMGKNAAGVVITNNPRELERLVPVHHSTSNPMGVSQYTHPDIEALGLVKMDILGSKTLTVLARAAELIGIPVPELLPIETESKVLMRDMSKEVYRQVGQGKTAGVFQLEGWSTQKGCKDLKPTTVHDLIAAMALFRPAVMDSGSTRSYLDRKHRRRPVPQMHEIIMRVTKKTMGIILYQEQVIDLLRELEMEPDDLTAFLKAVKASNKNIGNAQKVIDGYMPWIESEARRRGFSDADWFWLEHAFEAFGGYSFNRAHSTIYGLTAWRCAYLAHHHSLEFFCALLSVAAESSGKPARMKETRYVSAARDRGLRISRPSINASGFSYAIDSSRKNLIRRGLTSVKGVGQVAAAHLVAVRPAEGFSSIRDIAERVTPKQCSGGKDYLAALNSMDEPEARDHLNGVLSKLLEAEVLEEIL